MIIIKDNSKYLYHMKNKDNCNMIQTFIIVSIEYESNKARMIEYDCTVSRRRHVAEMRLSQIGNQMINQYRHVTYPCR